MEEPRPEKVAVVAEVREKFDDADAILFTEYRGLTVRDLAELRAAMREAGGEYKVYKNTLVRRAVAELELPVEENLVGPTAIAFVGRKPDGTPGDPVLVAKALQAFAKSNPHLVVKGGLLDAKVLDADGVKALATVAPREELLARFAGGLAAPMRNLAALMQALPLNFAYALKALIDAGGAEGAPAPAAAAESPEAPAEEASAEAGDSSTPDDSADADAAPAAAADEAATETDDNDDAASAATDDTPAAEAAAGEE
jgi:large subunit ribosomal protein L10